LPGGGTALRARGALALSVTLIALAACSGAAPPQAPVVSPPGGAPPATPPPRVVRQHINHVVIIVQENRSFDNFFHGFKGAQYANYGYMHDGTRVALHPTGMPGFNISHGWGDAINDWDSGRMDRFDENPIRGGQQAGPYAYTYVAQKYIQPYWTMAQRYVLADHMFPTMFGGSFTAHLDLIASTTNLASILSEVDTPDAEPWGCDAPAGTKTSVLESTRQELVNGGPFPCFTQFGTMADTLDDAGVSWAYYAPTIVGPGGRVWSEFDAIAGVRHGADWSRDVLSPQTRVLQDVADGRLRDVSWVIPDLKDSDHPGSGTGGPSWVASVVNAIGKSRYWKSSAIVVVWDDWGGWYDSVPPPQRDFRGLGIRVPCIIISPYAKRGYVSHTVYEFGSILKFVEEAFGLPSLDTLGHGSGYSDMRANSISDSFDFQQKPAPFQPIAAPLGPTYFLTRKPSLQPPDDQ
jgi:phospholipase C